MMVFTSVGEIVLDAANILNTEVAPPGNQSSCVGNAATANLGRGVENRGNLVLLR